MQTYTAKKADEGQRADVFVAKQYPQFARSALKNLFTQEKVAVNDKTAKAGSKLRPEDVVVVDDSQLFKQPKPLDLPIVYEDDSVIVIDKPVGILTHSKGALNLEPTVAGFIKNRLSDERLSGNRAGIVHRLDRGTSGLLIAAKTADSQKFLQKQFSTRKAKKTYLAIVSGTPEPGAAVIDAPIARNPKKPQTFKVSSSGRSAMTTYKVIKRLGKESLVELEPQTGRTHQLRVHMAYAGFPIIGDKLYGHNDGELMLHAHKLELRLPDGRLKKFSAPPPKHFKERLDNGPSG